MTVSTYPQPKRDSQLGSQSQIVIMCSMFSRCLERNNNGPHKPNGPKRQLLLGSSLKTQTCFTNKKKHWTNNSLWASTSACREQQHLWLAQPGKSRKSQLLPLALVGYVSFCKICSFLRPSWCWFPWFTSIYRPDRKVMSQKPNGEINRGTIDANN
jgi:hypothetical protein